MTNKCKRILVVDDEAHVTTVLKMLLERTLDYQVKVENTSTQALATAEAFQPDLILLDVDMPGMDGGDVVCQLNERPALKHVPVVFLTGSVTKKEVEATHGIIGGLRFMAKPMDRNEVLRCAAKHLKTGLAVTPHFTVTKG